MTLPSFEEVLSTTNLPTLPAVAIRILEQTRDDDVQLKEIARTIENDQSLAVKIIRTVNSSYYHLSRPCTSIEHAMAYLGLNTVKSLVLGFSLVDTLAADKQSDFDFIDYWRRGIFTATGARILASYTGLGDADDAFLAGLLQDIGMVAIYRATGDAYLETIQQTRSDHEVLVDLEDKAFGFTHATVGAEIARRWTLPDAIVEAIGEHHLTSIPDDEGVELRHTLQMARRIAEFVTTEAPEQALAQFRADVHGSAWFGIQEEEAGEIIQVVNDCSFELSELFRVKIGDARDINQLLTEAEDRMIEHQAAVTRQAVHQGTSKSIDSLTGMPNLQQLTKDLHDRFQRAQSSGRPMAVLLCNIDGTSAINEEHGYAVGDEVIKHVGRTLVEHAGSNVWVYRLESDVFAILAGHCHEAQASQLASDLRGYVANASCSAFNGGPTRVTISVGMTVFDPTQSTPFVESESLLGAANKALQAAKQTGDCIRVFVPTEQGKAA